MLIGSFITIAILAGIGTWRDVKFSLGRQRKFGNIQIFTKKDKGTDKYEGSNIETLYLAKDGIPFLSIFRVENSPNIKYVAGLVEYNTARFFMAPSEEKGKWKRFAYYKCKEKDITVGEEYLDGNFDGQFDIKYIHDDSGQIISEQIYYEHTWLEVTNMHKGKAISDQKEYVFDRLLGWQVKNNSDKKMEKQ